MLIHPEMSTTAGRVFAGLTRVSLGRGGFIHSSTLRVNSVRPLALSSRRPARSKKPTDDSEAKSEPITFSTSKASNSSWKVERAMGSKFERPWWKVLPFSLIGAGLLLWCVLRGKTDFDVLLEKQLHDQIPGLVEEEEEEEQQVNKSS